MIRWSVLFATLCILLAGTLSPASAQDTYSLEYKFVPGELIRYKMVIDMNMSMKFDGTTAQKATGSMQMPNMQMSMVIVTRQRTKKVLPNGDGQIAMAIESMKVVDPTGKTQQMPTKDLPVFTIVMGKNGVVKSVSGLEALQKSLSKNVPGGGKMPAFNPGEFNQLMGQYAVFPSVPVPLGQAWVVDIPYPVGTGSIRVMSTFQSIDEKAGQKLANLRQQYDGDIGYGMQMEIPESQQSKGGTANIQLAGKLQGDTTVDFALDKGHVRSMNGTIGMQMGVDFSATGGGESGGGTASIDMVMQMQMFKLPSGK